MSVAAYPAYKESEVGGLGRVPSHWELKRLRFAATLNPTKAEISHLDRETELSFLPMDAVGEDGSLRLDELRPISAVETGYTFFREGDVTFAKITPCFENGKGAIMRGLIGGYGFGTTELTVLRPVVGVATAEFLSWIICSPQFRAFGEGSMYGAGGQKRVPDDFARDFVAGFPSVSEQTAIATFLDRETGKIDALVEEQRRLIALLKEKRQAVISHAVTKGLNPNAPMKDSSIEWLGEVPAHWEVCKLGYAAKLQSGFAFASDDFQPAGTPIVRMNNLNRGRLELGDAVCVADCNVNDKVALAAGDLLWGMSGSIGETGSLGNFARVRIEDLPCQLNQRVGRLAVVDKTIGTDYMEHLIQSSVFTSQIILAVTGTAQFNVSGEQVEACLIAVPPLFEQRQIVKCLNLKVKAHNSLMAEAETGIALLQKRRAALISAAVTGKIDVRGLTAAPAAEEPA